MDLKKMLEKAFRDRLTGEGGLSGIGIPIDALSSLLGEDEENKTPIGKVSPELLKKFKMTIKAKDDLQDEIDLMIKQLQFETKRKIDEIFGKRIEQSEDDRQAIWDEISDYLDVPKDMELSIDRTNGMVSGTIEQPKKMAIVKTMKFNNKKKENDDNDNNNVNGDNDDNDGSKLH